MPSLPAGTVTFLFTDVESSTRLLQEHRREYPEAIARHHDILREAVTARGGVVFETVGDAVYAAFSRVEDAAVAAAEGQRSLHESGLVVPITVRMGIHTGDVELRGDHYFGPALYRCARIMAAGHGGQILVSDVSAGILEDVLPAGLDLRDLGVHRLKDLQRGERIHQLLAPGLRADFPPPRTLEAHPHNLPVFPTAFVGREEEIAAVTALLRSPDVRLLTLTGPGGTGKTRLGLQAAVDVIDHFQGGVYFVPLADARSADQVLAAIGSVLGVRERGRPMRDALADALRERRALLVLDNFEHLTEHGAVVSDLLARTAVRVLVTSRSPLRLRGEREHAVPSLGLPEPEGDPIAALERSDAARLFLERAREIRPDLALDERSAAAVAAICRRVDGLPLAIELAAARVRILTPEALLARLDRRLPLLTAGARDLPARQRTLRDTIAWSHELLDPRERVLFRRTAVFAGGWDLEAADAVLDPEGAGDTMDVLDSLVAKSLVRGTGAEGGDRFGLLETIREYALERLEESGERDALERRHAAYFAALAERSLPHTRGRDQVRWLRRLDAERDNFAAALAASIDGPADAAAGWRVVGALGAYWQIRGSVTEAPAWAARMADAPADVDDTVRALALAYAAWFAGEREDAAAAERWSTAAVAAARRSGDHAALVLALSAQMMARWRTDPSPQAREIGAVARVSADPWVAGLSFMCEGEWLRSRGEHEAAARDYVLAIEHGRESGDLGLLGMNLLNLANHHVRRGELGRAMELFAECIRMNVAVEDPWNGAYALAGVGGALVAAGRHERGLTALAAADAWLRRTGLRMQDTDLADHDRAVALARAALPHDAADRAWAAGSELTLEEATRLATEASEG